MPERKGDVGGAQDGASERTETATGALEFMRTSDFALEVRWVFGTRSGEAPGDSTTTRDLRMRPEHSESGAERLFSGGSGHEETGLA